MGGYPCATLKPPMKKTILLLLFLSFLAPLLLGAEDTTSSRLVGTWVWAAHRHDCTVTYNADGTYKADNDGTTIKGTWKIEGDQLIETQKGSSSAIPSKIVFDSDKSFTLDGFQTYIKQAK